MNWRVNSSLILIIFSGCAIKPSFPPPELNSNLYLCSLFVEINKWTNCVGISKYSNAKYYGEFQDGKPNGHGVYTFDSGNKYVGYFKDGMFNGRGTYFHLEDNQFKGDKYVGEFKDNKRNGLGVYLHANGTSPKEGVWVNGQFLRAEKTDQASPSNFTFQQDQQRIDDERIRQERVDIAAAAKRLAEERMRFEELQLAQVAVTKPDVFKNSRLNVQAIVIGNSAYSGSAKLSNPVNDAKAISQKLRGFGFNVTEVIDANHQRLISSLSVFKQKASAADMTLLFYAGHGVQISGTNYMLPIDLDLNDIAQAPLKGISLSLVVEQYLPGKTKLVFLDACRDNPLLQTASRSVSRGLAPINVSEGTLIAYSTKDGQVAQDGEGKNSPFTKALLDHLDDPEDIAVVLRKVREQVMKNTGGKQQPWEYGSLTGGSLVLSAIKLSK